jgi:aminopeptidase N
MITAYQSNQPMQVPEMLIEAFRQTLLNGELDPALIARVLTLPGESYIADQMDVVDVDAIFAAREALRTRLAESLQAELMDIYNTNKITTEYQFNAQDMAVRSLNNVVLAYLVLLDNNNFHTSCYNQYQNASNMTDRMAALSALVDLESPLRDSALDDFYQHWQNDKQVVEKWFALQAGSKLPQTLENVKSLMQHPAFSLNNPNKVRSLIGRFCAGNPVRFHASDGSGYRFLGDQVLALDAMNPQIAARLVQSFSRWRRFDETRQQLMREQLERIVAQENLSKDVFEIASKSLE